MVIEILTILEAILDIYSLLCWYVDHHVTIGVNEALVNETRVRFAEAIQGLKLVHGTPEKNVLSHHEKRPTTNLPRY